MTHRLFTALLAVLLAGCAVAPQPLTNANVRARVQADQYKIYSAQEHVFKPIDFREALARSLSYNLDYRLKLMEAALSQGLAEVSTFDMLPNLVASAGYTHRNNLAGSQSFQITNGAAVDSTPASYSGGQERQRNLASIEFSWSVLDFGVGYYRAKQAANQVLIAEERRRRVVQNILQDVRSAYWRAVGAQRLSRDTERLMERVRTALQRSREAEAQGLLPPRDALGYQRLLLDAVNLLASRRQELDFAKRELAALMNITPGTDFEVADEAEPALFPMPLNIAELEELALVNRPELRQEDYQARVTADETRRQLLTLLPNLSLNVSSQYDSNKYLYTKDWIDASSRVTFNLFRALSMPATERARQAQVVTDDTRRMALSMAVLTQVRVALERYQMSLNELEVAKESHQVDQRMAAYARAALTSNVDSELELIRADTRALNSEFQRYASYAAAQAAFGRIYNSVGLEVVPEGVDKLSIRELGETVANFVAQTENETFVRLVAQKVELPRLSVRYDGVLAASIPLAANRSGMKLEDGLSAPQEGDATLSAEALSGVVAAAEKALRRNGMQLSTEPNSLQLRYRLLIDAPRNGVRRAQWVIALAAPDGKILGESRYTSALAAQPSPRSVSAFAEAATISNLRNLAGWLQPKN